MVTVQTAQVLLLPLHNMLLCFTVLSVVLPFHREVIRVKQLAAARVVAVGEHQHRRSETADEWRHGGATRGFPSVRPTVPTHPSSLKDLHALPYPFLGGNSQSQSQRKEKTWKS